MPETHIHLVDDDPIVLNTLRHGLEASGYRVSSHEHPDAALAAYADDPPDLAVIDMGLPKMSGAKLAAAMLETAYRPLIVLSSHNEQDFVKQAISAGVAAYLVKPVSAQQIIPSIETALARFREIDRQLSMRFNDHENSDQLGDILDQLAFSMLVIDRDHFVVRHNRSAAELMQSKDVLKTEAGRLTTIRELDSQRFRKYLDRLFLPAVQMSERLLSLQKQTSADHYQVCGNALLNPDHKLRADAIVLTVIDPVRSTSIPAQVLRSLYALTRSESKLAEALINGHTLEQYAQDSGTKMTTIRTHLRSIFQKTGTTRQTDLVLSLSRLFHSVNVS
ncbi:MAG: response regulator [Gammaproteobacteria bacterium]|nr:response regulator [Gammaproteobacteria bacterium]